MGLVVLTVLLKYRVSQEKPNTVESRVINANNGTDLKYLMYIMFCSAKGYFVVKIRLN